KYRAARKLWAQTMRDRYGAADERSWKLRFHAQTAGCSLTWQQPYNNVARTALQAMAAVLGGAQSLHTNSLDEAWALPGEHAATIALRTQQVIAYESGLTAEPDPLGGSYFLEHLTGEMEQGARVYMAKIDAMGGMIPAIEAGYPQSEIARSSYEYQRKVESGEAVVVGVNRFAEAEEKPIDLLRIDRAAEAAQCEKLRRLRAERSNEAATRALGRVRKAAGSGENLMPSLIDAVRAYATLGEICDALRDVFGVWVERAAV
ncbi:MAG: methylmalonyl-CoA mutase, partial [Acidobacteriota bacterium]|nr:methylmalonyl-CoA mutase [Acidobacteriota bacterium]